MQMMSFHFRGFVKFPMVVLMVLIGQQTARGELITYTYTADVDPNGDATFAGVTLPSSAPFSTTGTLTFDRALPPTTSIPSFSSWTSDVSANPLGSVSEVTLDLGGSTISTEPGELDAFIFDIGGAVSDVAFTVEMDAASSFTSGNIFVNGADSGVDGFATLAFGTTTAGPFGGSLNFELMTGDPNAFASNWIVPGGGQLDITNVELTGFSFPGTNNVVPEPASIAIWSLLSLALGGYGYVRARRRR